MKRILIAAVICLAVSATANVVFLAERFAEKPENIISPDEFPPVVIRIDDIQDWWARDEQMLLIEYNIARGVPMTLGVIPDLFGQDNELVETVAFAVEQGSEIADHGWGHVVFPDFQLDEQARKMLLGKEKLREVLGVEVSTFIPPLYRFNSDTLLAMRDVGYTVISSHVHLLAPGSTPEEVVSIPATVEFSYFVDGTWLPKSLDTLLVEILRSVRLYGYACIVTHPQEFVENGEFSPDRWETYTALISHLKEMYSFTVIGELRAMLGTEV